METIYLAIDIGASSGRHIIITKQDDIFLDEVYRFKHDYHKLDGHLYWPYDNLIKEVKEGIKLAIKKYPKLKSIAIDTWGVDYTYIDKEGLIIRDPMSYRDPRGEKIVEDLYQVINKTDLYLKTGIQFMNFNSIYQIAHDLKHFKADVDKANKLLMMPDLIGYYLTGEMALEYTNFSTTNMMNAISNAPITELEALGIKSDLLPKIVKPGNLLGYLDIFSADELKHKKIKVFNVCSHDTASAYASVKKEKGVAVLNSGTWSLLGTMTDKPIINELAMQNNFTNEAGIEGTRFLKNIMGMWIINQCKNQWASEGQKLTYKTIEKKALSSDAYSCFINPDDAMFNSSDNMPLKIQTYCKSTNQSVPKTVGEITRCVFESLAFKYRYVLERLEETLGYKLDKILMIGGGTQSNMLNELTSKLTQREVIIGPVEATVLGNAIVQMLANGDITELKEGQDLISRHHTKVDRQPFDKTDEKAYKRFLKIIKKDVS